MTTKIAPRPKTPTTKTKAAPKREPVRNTKPAPAKRAARKVLPDSTPAVDDPNVAAFVGQLDAGESIEVEVSATITTPELTSDTIAAMSHEARIELARIERDQLRTAKANGTTVPTPVLDWMLDPSSLDATRPRKASGARGVERSPEDVEAIKATIIEARAAGQSWHGVGKTLTERNISTARGGRWYAVTVRDTARRLGVANTPTTAKD